MFDTGLWLFVGLVVLWAWRGICWWRCCGHFLRYFNYISLMLALLFVILVYDCWEFYTAWASPNGHSTWDGMPGWVKLIVYASPIIVWLIFILGSYQIWEHMVCIQEENAVLRHDRAVQIIILPLVYGTMCLSCVTKCYTFMRADSSAQFNEGLPLAVTKAETCLWIGDLYESWALYQFGILSLEVMESSLLRQSRSKDIDERAAANALLAAHKAVVRLAWLGILSFVLVSVADSAVALWYLTFGVEDPNLVAKFNNAENQFNIAGFLASGAAIFNVYIVETQFHHYLQDFHPYLKFLTVKILVSFAYGQQYLFVFLQTLNFMAPPHVQDAVRQIPVLGTIINFNDLEFYMFYSALLVIECLLIGITHVWAWGGAEQWYEDEEDEAKDSDKALLPGEKVLYGTTAP